MKRQLSLLSGIIVFYVILLKIISRLTGKAFCFYPCKNWRYISS
jgi:hypothetical protein